MAVVIKVILIILLCFIFFSLGCALFYLVRDKKSSDRVVKALTWRIGLSVVLFLLIIIFYLLGVISPHPLP